MRDETAFTRKPALEPYKRILQIIYAWIAFHSLTTLPFSFFRLRGQISDQPATETSKTAD